MCEQNLKKTQRTQDLFVKDFQSKRRPAVKDQIKWVAVTTFLKIPVRFKVESNRPS